MIRQIHKGVRNRANKELNSGDGPRTEHLRWAILCRPLTNQNIIFSQTDLAHTLIGFVGPILLTPQMFGVPKGVDMTGFIHYWKVLGYLHGIKDEFNPFRKISNLFPCVITCFHFLWEGNKLENVKSDDLALTRDTIAEVTASCMIPKLYSPPPMFDKMSQVRRTVPKIRTFSQLGALVSKRRYDTPQIPFQYWTQRWINYY